MRLLGTLTAHLVRCSNVQKTGIPSNHMAPEVPDTPSYTICINIFQHHSSYILYKWVPHYKATVNSSEQHTPGSTNILLVCWLQRTHKSVWQQASGIPRIFFRGAGLTNSVEDRGQREGDLGVGFHSICRWVKPIFLLGSYGCIFHVTGNLARLCRTEPLIKSGSVVCIRCT
jgi:hypothetical protein